MSSRKHPEPAGTHFPVCVLGWKGSYRPAWENQDGRGLSSLGSCGEPAALDLAEGRCYSGFSVQEGRLVFLALPAVRFWNLLSGSCFKMPLPHKAADATAP